MPDRRQHRGPHPDDLRLFSLGSRPALQAAVDDLAWLLSRGYAPKSALKLVGDRYDLLARQRTAVARCACSDSEVQRRRSRQVACDAIRGEAIWLDGYNVLTTIEAALAGGVILPGRDGTYRDMASMHGSYRKVAETRPALELIGKTLAELEAGPCHWYLDSPVSNSGRLKGIIQEVAAEHQWAWDVELVHDPDPILAESPQIAATADSAILDRCARWFNLARETVDRQVSGARVLEFQYVMP